MGDLFDHTFGLDKVEPGYLYSYNECKTLGHTWKKYNFHRHTWKFWKWRMRRSHWAKCADCGIVQISPRRRR